MLTLFTATKKIGIYIAGMLAWSRTYTKENIPFGLKAIISEIDINKYDIDYCDKETVNNFDFILYSVNSDKDYLILIRDFYKKNIKPKIIVGGADLININIIRDVIDIAVIGRAEGQINQILDGEKFSNVWRKEDDYNFNNKYTVRQPQYLLKVGNKREVNIGCNYGCLFCQYGSKFKSFIKTNSYDSGNTNNEVMFKDIDWNNAKGMMTSSIDGSTEETRRKVKKKLSNDSIINKIKEAYNVNINNRLLLKLYNIIGYSWEDELTANLSELLYVFKESDISKAKQKIWINLKFNHFIPMLLTPMESEPLNTINYRDLIINKFTNDLFIGNNIHVKIFNGFASSSKAMDRTYIYRSFDIDKHILDMTKKKYYIDSVDKRFNMFKDLDIFKATINLPSKIYSNEK